MATIGSLPARLVQTAADWLSQDVTPRGVPRTDFERLCEQIQPVDVILVEGRSRVAGIIQSVTLSAWTHAALYIGRAEDTGKLDAFAARFADSGARFDRLATGAARDYVASLLPPATYDERTLVAAAEQTISGANLISGAFHTRQWSHINDGWNSIFQAAADIQLQLPALYRALGSESQAQELEQDMRMRDLV